ncbi:TetR/AcrR family transcriptional regulator [Cryptosporangium arvum]|uniref:TetR/AcrR family transcriptional regulator n=1 Tax=Cryptosporangium arvum TaxID=80871 RepID=UPI0004BB0BFA|nr:TetR/AcrR family transcriptional regulator [Cryptosporangium arvum]
MSPLRADAARNRALLLAAAADEFDEHGLDASVADIARRAGVGKGTVFRHFPTKDDLIAAIVRSRIEELNAVAEELLTADDAGAALFTFVETAARRQQERDLSFLRGAASPIDAQQRMATLLDRLVERAHEQGALRPDVTGTDVLLLMCAPNHVVSFAPDASPDLWRRYLAIIVDGLRPEGARPLPEPPPAGFSG